jgi:hypothetical protein
MSTKIIGAVDRGSCQAVRLPETLAYWYMHQLPFVLSAPQCRRAAINAAWVDLTNQRLRENFRLPRELGRCTSLPALLRAYSNYCQAAIRQYQSAMQ